MQFSYNWLKELVSGLEDYTPAKVAELLTAHSFETVIAEEFSLDPLITVVRIESIEPHPNADRLRLATVTDGKETIKVVCGAANIEVGQIVPYSPPGTKVFDKDGQLFELTVAKIRGVESPGMLNSRRELGLGSDHDGIFVLPSDTPLGSKLSDHIPSDVLLEADITPNRAHDALSHHGVARELAALLDLKVIDLEKKKLPVAKEEVDGYKLSITDEKNTPRYMNVIMSGVKNGNSPLWMQARLMMLGQKPINALVDITNYVMWEMGNPSHAFDAVKLPGKTIGVRGANKAQEEIELLDGSKKELPQETLVVTGSDTPIAIAGVMGGKSAEAGRETTNVVLEIANFNAYSIQKTAFALNLRTDAAARFLKGIDPNLVSETGARIAHLVHGITGGKVEGVLDFYPQPFVPAPTTFRPARVSKIAGADISEEASLKALTSLRFTVKKDGEVWQVTPPSDRLDVTAEHDVIEEIIFYTGLHTISAKQDIETVPTKKAHSVFVREAIRSQLASQGLTETYNYSFADDNIEKSFKLSWANPITLTNPIAPEFSHLRTSLLPKLLGNMMKNKAEFLRKNTKTQRALFEIGHVYEVGEGKVPGVKETENLATTAVVPLQETLKGLLQFLNIPVEYKPFPENPLLKNGTQTVWIGEQYVGLVGELSPAAASGFKYRVPLYVFELDLNVVILAVPQGSEAALTLEEIKNSSAPIQYEELNRFPSVYRDISLLIDVSLSVEKVKEVIERAGGELVVDTDLFDEYEPDDDGAGTTGKKKSLSFHIEYQAKDKTLTDAEVSQVQKKIEQAVAEELEAEIR